MKRYGSRECRSISVSLTTYALESLSQTKQKNSHFESLNIFVVWIIIEYFLSRRACIEVLFIFIFFLQNTQSNPYSEY